jgi:hypothetical protein
MLTDAHKEIRKAINTDILLQYDTAGEGVPRKKKYKEWAFSWKCHSYSLLG